MEFSNLKVIPRLEQHKNNWFSVFVELLQKHDNMEKSHVWNYFRIHFPNPDWIKFLFLWMGFLARGLAISSNTHRSTPQLLDIFLSHISPLRARVLDPGETHLLSPTVHSPADSDSPLRPGSALLFISSDSGFCSI